MKQKTWKTTALLALVTLVAAALCGCTAKPVERPVDAPQTVETQPAAQPEQTASESQSAPAPTYVENNGAYFVRLSDGVYFHRYGSLAMGEAVLWGEFLYYLDAEQNSAALCRIDPQSGAVTELFEDGCGGKLYWCGDRFYCKRSVDDGVRICTVQLDGTVNDLGSGTVAGVSEDAAYVALWRYGEDETLRVLDASGAERCAVTVPDGSYYEFCGMCGDTAVYLDVTDGHATLCAVSAAETVELGELPMESEFAYPQCEQFLCDGEDVYVLLANYEGSASMLNDYTVVCAQPDQQGSMSIVQEGYDAERMPGVSEFELPRLTLADGALSYCAALPGTVELTDGTSGDLVYYETPEHATRLASGFIRTIEEDALRVQTAEAVDGTAYLIVASMERAPDEDIGWRWAYRLNELYYLRLPLTEDAAIETLTGADWSEASNFDEAGYADYLGRWRKVAGSAESDERVEAEPGSWVEFTQERTALMHSEFGDKTFQVTAAAEEDGCKLYGETTDGDQLYAFFEDGELVVSVLEYFITEYGSDAISWTGFYTR